MSEEIWKPIKGYEGLYSISNLGNVYSHYHNRLLKPNKNRSGNYVGVILSKQGKQKRFQIHRLVAQAFVPNPYNLPIVNHKNEIQNDNRADNLEWCTHQYNCNYNDLPKRIGFKVSQTVKLKGGAHNKGKSVPKEIREKISNTLKQYYKNNPVSQEIRAKISKSVKNSHKNKNK